MDVQNKEAVALHLHPRTLHAVLEQDLAFRELLFATVCLHGRRVKELLDV